MGSHIQELMEPAPCHTKLAHLSRKMSVHDLERRVDFQITGNIQAIVEAKRKDRNFETNHSTNVRIRGDLPGL